MPFSFSAIPITLFTLPHLLMSRLIVSAVMIHDHYVSAIHHTSLSVQDIVNAICDDENIKAVSFVGSDAVSFLPVLLRWLPPYSM